MRRLRIGDWLADATTNELGRGGETLHLEPKVMEVLAVLARHAGQAVTREQLLAAVWPGVVVGDEALTQCIIKLRRALGDNPRAPAYIETISKRGYRLIAQVSAETDPAPAPGESPPGRLSVRAIGLGVATLAAAVVVALLYTWLRPADVPRPPPEAGVPRDVVTLSVLPFESLGDDPGQQRLAAGIRNDLMTDLSRISRLRVVAVTAAPAGGEAGDARRFVVSGSVQRESQALRIHVRLTDARTQEQLWSQRYERPVGDLFAIQSEISRGLAEQLPARISEAEKARVAKRYTHSLEAYEHFLRAQSQVVAQRDGSKEQALAEYAKAVELDPRFARAYAGMAIASMLDRARPTATQGPAETRRALELAETARLIDPDIPEVHWALGFVHVRSRRHDQAIAALQRAIELNPSYADAYALLGGIYTYVGEPEKSIPLLRTALRLNPEGGYLYYLLLGRAYLFLEDCEQARINLREALIRNAGDVESRLYLAATLVCKGDLPAAEWEAEEIRSEQPGFSTKVWLETYPLTSDRHSERLITLAAKVGL